MVGSSHQEEAIVTNINHPSHTDPVRLGFYAGASVFCISLILLLIWLRWLPIGMRVFVAGIAGVGVGVALIRWLRQKQLNKEVAALEAKREEHRLQTEKAIAEMKRREAERS